MQLNTDRVYSGQDITVVIPAYEYCPFLPSIIQRLLEQTTLPKSIIVVHTGPHDPTEPIGTLSTSVQVIHQNERLLAGAARNIGIARSQTEWVAFLDADVMPDKNWCGEIVEAVNDNAGQVFCGALGVERSGGYWGLCLWYIEFGSVHPYMPSRRMENAPSANMFARRELLQDCGGFPEHYQPGEDAALQLTMRDRGFPLHFVADALAFHHNLPGFAHYQNHLKKLGSFSAYVRKKQNLRGSFAARNPLAAIALLPARFAQISYRVFRYGVGSRKQYLSLVPGILIGLLLWNIGFLMPNRYLPESLHDRPT